MAWDTVLVDRLRYVINDFDSSSYLYNDTQLKKFLVIAATFVITEAPDWTSIFGDYVIDTSAITISPDPVDTSPLGFSNLVVLKAACIISRAELKKIGATGGWKITDDRSTIDGTGAVENAKQWSIDACDAYKKTLEEYQRGNSSAGEAIFGPYSSANGPRAGTYGYPPHR